MQRIEDSLTPTTATEAALLDRIGVLRRQLWEAGLYANTSDGFPVDPNLTSREVRYFTPTLHLAARADAALDLPRGLRIEARTHGAGRLGVAHYVSLEALQELTFFDEARALTHIHEKVIRSTGKLVSDHLRK